jgi:hypothetical protein
MTRTIQNPLAYESHAYNQKHAGAVSEPRQGSRITPCFAITPLVIDLLITSQLAAETQPIRGDHRSIPVELQVQVQDEDCKSTLSFNQTSHKDKMYIRTGHARVSEPSSIQQAPPPPQQSILIGTNNSFVSSIPIFQPNHLHRSILQQSRPNNTKYVAPSATKTFHHDVYAAINPTNPHLSAAGKTVLITGGGQGIGVSFAKAFSWPVPPTSSSSAASSTP